MKFSLTNIIESYWSQVNLDNCLNYLATNNSQLYSSVVIPKHSPNRVEDSCGLQKELFREGNKSGPIIRLKSVA